LHLSKCYVILELIIFRIDAALRVSEKRHLFLGQRGPVFLDREAGPFFFPKEDEYENK